MKVSHEIWKERLEGQLSEQLADEIKTFEVEIERRRQDKVDEKIFAETRLRRGVYGQRYDNGQRYDGEQTKQLAQTVGPSRSLRFMNCVIEYDCMTHVIKYKQ